MLSLVICWDSNVNKAQRGVRVAESDGWNVDVGGLLDRLQWCNGRDTVSVLFYVSFPSSPCIGDCVVTNSLT